jgi:hypothetical protein
MALATGVEAPSSAIAGVAKLDDAGRRRFGRWALLLTLGIVAVLTLALAATAVRLGVGIPPAQSTQIAEVARRAGVPWVFAAFQATTALLLLSAASSSFQADPGLLKALARRTRPDGAAVGVLSASLARVNRHHVPMVGVIVFWTLSVAVFVSFLVGLVAMAVFARREGQRGWLVLNSVAAVAVAFTLAVNPPGWPRSARSWRPPSWPPCCSVSGCERGVRVGSRMRWSRPRSRSSQGRSLTGAAGQPQRP